LRADSVAFFIVLQTSLKLEIPSMSFTRWLSESLSLSSRNPGRAARPASKSRATATRRTFSPAIERLEDRWVPSTIRVNHDFNIHAPADAAVPHGTLEWAVDYAQNGDTILLTGEALQHGGITLTHGELILRQQNLTITTEAGQPPVTISGGGLSRVFEVASGAQVTLSNLVITGGNGVANNPVSNGYYNHEGGGILVFGQASLTVNGCTIFGNSTDYGGGIAAIGSSSSTLTIRDSIISDNSALIGGGLFLQAVTAVVANSMLTGNTAGWGGAIFIGVSGGPEPSTLMLTSGAVSGNSAEQFGGGIYNQAEAVTINGTTVSGNSAGIDGGGIYNLDLFYANATGRLTVTNGILSGNTAGRNGGGIFNSGGTVTLSGSILGMLTVGGNTLPGNNAGYAGGGIYNQTYRDPYYGEFVGTVTVADSSHISGNHAPVGADVYNLGVLYQDASSIIGFLVGNAAIPI
jgi:hypothetical protein